MNQRAETLQIQGQVTFLPQIVGRSEHLAKISQLPDLETDLMATAQALCAKYLDSSGKLKKNIDPNGCSMKTLRECCHQIKDLTSSKYSMKWPHSATISSTSCLIQKTSECHKTEKGCTLSDILEPEVMEKYFLSDAIAEKLLMLSKLET